MILQRCVATSCVLAVVGASVFAAPPTGLKQKIDAWVTANQRVIVTELVDLLAIPNVAADRENITSTTTSTARTRTCASGTSSA